MYKRFAAEIGKQEYMRMGMKTAETLYFGKRPNCVRIYNKITEFQHQYRQLQRRSSDAAEIPPFEEIYGYPERGVTLTRVERQIGSRMPKTVQTFGDFRSLPDFNPFVHLR